MRALSATAPPDRGRRNEKTDPKLETRETVQVAIIPAGETVSEIHKRAKEAASGSSSCDAFSRSKIKSF